MKRILLIILAFFISIIKIAAQDEATILPSQIGTVQNVKYIDIGEGEVAQVKQEAEIKLKDGNLVLVENMITGNPYYDIKLKKGVKVILHVEDEGDGLNFFVEDIKRSGNLIWLSLIFCSLLVYVGKKKGLYSLISIAISCFLITNLLSPMILDKIHPVVATIIICLLSTAVTMYLVGGFNKKSTSATIGCTLSLIVAGLLSLIVTKTASLTGFNNENSMFLFSAHPELDFIGITISTMILATLGAVMDVGMSISSTINEIYTIDNTKTVKELFISGMNVGRDIIGTMANTLILVYLGGSLPLVLLASNIDLQKFVNLNQVVTEIASALIGSIAIVICVPITAIVASKLIKSSTTDKTLNFKNSSDILD
jgi:uncharacterized membrane protein